MTAKPDIAVRGITATARSYAVCTVDLLCPHCGYYSVAEGPIVTNTSTLVKCHRCSQTTMIEAVTVHSPSTVNDYYPRRQITVDPFVPKEIAEDYLEAQRCFLAGAWHGCAVMARRCLHSVAEHFNAIGKDLYEQIKDLQVKQIITPVLAEQAQHVRVLGKHGAHPYDTKGNELKDLGIDDAQTALEFCDFIFDQVFVQPEKIKASKSRLTT